jgi:hypothetical protein
LIDYSKYLETTADAFDTAQEQITLVPLFLLNKRLIVLSLIFLVLIALNVAVAIRVSELNYNLSRQETQLKNLQNEKASLLNKANNEINPNREIQQARYLGLKSANTNQIRFYR